MIKNEVTWKCPNCDRLITNLLYIYNKDYARCDCGILCQDFDKFIINKDDTIDQLTPLELAVEKTIVSMMDNEYRKGYTKGMQDGWLKGYGDCVSDRNY